MFNLYEAAPFWKCKPMNTLVLQNEEKLAGKSKRQNHSSLCCIFEGEKIKPLVIGRSKNPHGSSDINLEIPYWVFLQQLGQGGCKIFGNAGNLDRQMKIEQSENIFIFDNTPVDCIDDSTRNIGFLFLPPNCTSKIQPLDRGIIGLFKCHYRKILTRNLSRSMIKIIISIFENFEKR